MKTKKILSVLLVALMALAFSGLTAFAASITVEKPETDGTDATQYTYYQILKASISEDGEKVAYYVEDEAQATALEGTGVFTVTKVVGAWTVELVEGKTGEDIAAALDGIKDNFTASAPFKAGEKQDVAPGYYLVTSSLGTKVVVKTFKDEKINEKNEFPAITKSVDPKTAAIGDTVTFTVEVTIPATASAKDIVITDTADAGLTLDTVVTVAGAEGFTSTTIASGKITIPGETVAKNAGKKVTLTYTATVNADIITDATAAVNSAKNTVVLKYADFTSKEATATVSTYAVKVKKTDGETELTGAEFTLWDAAQGGNQIFVAKQSDGVYYVATEENDTVIEAGTATIVGLDAKAYYLQEEVAPTGYNKLAARQAANVSIEDIAEVEVINKAGVELPETGAFGTTMFYVVGVLAILGAGVFMVTNKRIAKEEF